MHLCPHCCCTTMTALPQTGSDTGIRTQDLRDMSPTRTTSPPYRNKLAGSQGFEPCTLGLTGRRTCLMCFLPNTWWILLESNQQAQRARFYRPLRLTTLPIRSRIWSARKDLNLRPHGSKPSTLPDCATDRELLVFPSCHHICILTSNLNVNSGRELRKFW